MTGKRFKIVILIKGLGLGGAERLIVDSLPYLNREQFEYEFAYLLPWKGFLAPQIEAAGFPVHCLGMSTSYHLPLMLRPLQRLLRQGNFDLIHADLTLPGVIARIAGRLEGVPVIYTEHNVQERYHPLTRWANWATYSWNTCALAVSQEVAASMARFGLSQQTRVITLLNGVPVEQVKAEASHLNGLREELGIPPKHLVVGSVAVFSSQKRLQDWVAVAAQIAKQRSDVTFLLVGHGPEEAMIRARVQALGIENRVRLPGFRPDGRRVLNLMDVYLMTSEHEGLPIALLEAMTLEKPVVCTAVGGIPELVQAGEEGFLTPVGAIGELAQHTITLLDDPQRRSQMGEQGLNKVSARFHIKHRAQFIENLYLEVLQPSQ